MAVPHDSSGILVMREGDWQSVCNFEVGDGIRFVNFTFRES
jgi:hypothetical protein